MNEIVNDNDTTQKVPDEVICLLKICNEVNEPRWHDVKGEDEYSLSFLLGDTEEGCSDRTECMLKAAGMMEHNSRWNTHSFCPKKCRSKIQNSIPSLMTEEPVRMGQKKHHWILIGTNGTIPSSSYYMQMQMKREKSSGSTPSFSDFSQEN